MTTLLLQNLRILDPFGEREFLDHASILIEDGLISGIYTDNFPEAFTGTRIDMAGKAVLPGMINAHTHLYSALAMGMPAPKNTPRNFVEILKEIWWKLDRALDEDSTRASFQAGLMDCLTQGTTTILDHHASPLFVSGSLDMLAETALEFGVNIGIAFEISDRNGQQNFLDELTENLQALKRYQAHPSIVPLVGLHASFTLSDDSLRHIRESLTEFKQWGIHIHVAEDGADEKDARQRGYPSVIQRLDHFNLLNENTLVVHGLFMPPEDLQILTEHDCHLVHNPSSNANNGVGILSSETIDMLQAGLGTDGMQANMLSEAREGTLIRSGSPEKPVDYLKLLFVNNPKIASHFFGRHLGHIRPGDAADLVFFDYHPRTELNETNMGSHLLFGLKTPSDVMTRGQFRIRDSEMVGTDAEKILADARTQSTRLWNKMKEL